MYRSLRLQGFRFSAVLMFAALFFILAGTALAEGRGVVVTQPAPMSVFQTGQQVQLAALVKTQYPKTARVDFRANGQLVGSGTNGNWRAVWTPLNPGTYTITAHAVSRQNTVIASAGQLVNVQGSAWSVLYDALGGPNAPGGPQPWGWDYANPPWYSPALSTYSQNGDGGDSYNFQVISIAYNEQPLSTPKTIKRIEGALVGHGPNGEFRDLSACPFKLKVWNKDIYPFQQNAFTPSINPNNSIGFGYDLGQINMGSTTVPIGTKSGYSVYYIGWDNLNIPLPANVPLQLSLQARSNACNTGVRIFSSNLITGTTLFAAGCSGCGQDTGPEPVPFSLRVMVQQQFLVTYITRFDNCLSLKETDNRAQRESLRFCKVTGRLLKVSNIRRFEVAHFKQADV